MSASFVLVAEPLEAHGVSILPRRTKAPDPPSAHELKLPLGMQLITQSARRPVRETQATRGTPSATADFLRKLRLDGLFNTDVFMMVCRVV